MNRRALPVIIGLAISPQIALARCVDHACIPIIMCIDGNPNWFSGQITAMPDGAVTGQFSNGPTCTGQQEPEDGFGFGYVNLTCDDGSEPFTFLFYQDFETDVLAGKGLTLTDETTRSWMGQNLSTFFANEDNRNHAEVLCKSELPALE